MKRTMKTAAFLLCALAVLCVPALSLAVTQEEAGRIAQEAVGGGATLGRIERDDGLYEASLSGEGVRYRVDVNDDGKVVEIETLYANVARARSFDLSRDQAREAALEAKPGAEIDLVLEERDDGISEYEVFYSTPDETGMLSLNAQTGEPVELKVWPLAHEMGLMKPSEVVALVKQRESGAEVADISLDYGWAGYQYEGEAYVGRMEISFELDAATGDLYEWEWDD